MSGYKGHLVGATVFFAAYFAALAFVFSVDAAYRSLGSVELVGYPVALFALCLMFGLWPDVDTNSKGQNVFYTLFFAADLFLIGTRRLEWAAYLGLFALLPILGRHRGWTHTLWAMLLIPSPLLILPWVLVPTRPLAGLPFYGAAVVGYLSHLVMDGMVFSPFGRRKGRGR